MQRVWLISSKNASTLADKLRAAVTSELGKSKQIVLGSSAVKDDNNEDFRELFVMPKRKLRGQMQLEQATGRAERKVRSRMDINDRLAERSPRSEEMEPEQEWSNVWPAPRTYASSVVPLPVRMGSRPNVEKRAPFKKEGNLELVKIPNFLHLTPAAIEKHCNAIKHFCTPFPPELLQNEELVDSELPISVHYNSYVHQGTNIRDNRSRVVTMTVNVKSLKLTNDAEQKLIRLAKDKYDRDTKTLTIITDRCHTQKQNLDYAHYLLTVLYHEANKAESWESLQERVDHLEVVFEGSTAQKKLIELVEKSAKSDKLNCDVDSKTISSNEKFVKFAEMWTVYRNKEETVESTREYSRNIKELLGIQKSVSSIDNTKST